MVERAQLPGPVATGEKRGSGRKTRSQEAPAETEALMQFTPEGNEQMAHSYEVAATRVLMVRERTVNRMARLVLYSTARRFEKAADWHRDRAATDRRRYAEKTKP